MADVSTLFINGETYYIKDSTARATADENASRLSGIKLWTGVCQNSETDSALTVTLDNATGFSLASGNFILVNFIYGNRSEGFTINVNGTGAKQVLVNSNNTTVTRGNIFNIGVGDAALFCYLGSQWVFSPTSRGLTTALAPKASPALTGTPTAPTAAAGTNTTQIATTAFVQNAVQAASGGAVAFQGVINSNTAISGLSSYTAGWYWVVGTAGTYVGQTCEVGDMIFCKANRGSAYSASDFNVVQVNVTGLGALAYKDSATGTVTPASKSITQLSSAGTMTSISSSYENEILSISWTNGQAPQGAAVSVADTQAVNVTVS